MSHGPLGNGRSWVAPPSEYFDDAAVRLGAERARDFPPLTDSWLEALERWQDRLEKNFPSPP
jgi:hypothetical protein